MNYSELAKYALTDIEKKYFDVIVGCGSQSKVAEHFNVSENSVYKAVRRVKRRAAQVGYAPDHDMTKTCPEGFNVKGTSTLYDDEGNVKIQWVKTDKDREEALELLKEAVEAIIEPCKDIVKPTPPPKHTTGEFMACYPIADAHLGMYAWDKESGADYDVNICKRILTESMDGQLRYRILGVWLPFLHLLTLLPISPSLQFHRHTAVVYTFNGKGDQA